MVITFPPPITQFFNVLETFIYSYNIFGNQVVVEDNYLIEYYKTSKDVFISFIRDFIDDTYDSWKLAKILTDDSTKNFEKYINSLEDFFIDLKNDLYYLDDVFNEGDKQKMVSLSEKILKKTVFFIDLRNIIEKKLSNQKALSPFPIIDKFLKIFWLYVNNIRDLEKFPVDLLIKYLLISVKFIDSIEVSIKEQIDLFNSKDSNIGGVEGLLDNQMSFVEAIKYALGAAYELINGSIDLSEDPSIVQKIFIQINQASNGLFLIEAEKSKKISFWKFLKDIPPDFRGKYFSYNKLINLLLNPLVINYFSYKIKDGLFLDNLSKILNSYEVVIDNEQDVLYYFLDQISEAKEVFSDNLIKELILAFVFFINFNLPLSTFLNILSNIKNFVRIYVIFSNDDKLSNISLLLDDLLLYSVSYAFFSQNFSDFYTNFLFFISSLSNIVSNLSLMRKVVCPKCGIENDFLSVKCIECGFSFPLSVEKMIMINFQDAPFLIQSYVFGLIDSYLLSGNKEVAIEVINNTIDELSKIIDRFKDNDEDKQNIINMLSYLYSIRDGIENDIREKVMENILNLILSSVFLKKYMSLNESKEF